MRVDKFLKISRILKRRTVANDAAKGGRVTVNGKQVKPSYDLKVGDVCASRFGDEVARFRVLMIKEVVKKDEVSKLYEILPPEEEA